MENRIDKIKRMFAVDDEVSRCESKLRADLKSKKVDVQRLMTAHLDINSIPKDITKKQQARRKKVYKSINSMIKYYIKELNKIGGQE